MEEEGQRVDTDIVNIGATGRSLPPLGCGLGDFIFGSWKDKRAVEETQRETM